MQEQSLDRVPYRGHNLVFIVGCPRSGTTWLQRLLASHPNVHTGQESYVFEYLAPQLRTWRKQRNTDRSGGRGGVGLPCYYHEAEFMQLLHEYMVKLLEPMIAPLGDGELFIEKTPLHALMLPEIVELLPECRVVHILRDPRDVVASLLAASKGWGAKWAPRNALRAARKWEHRVLDVRQAAREMPPEQFFEVRYEELSISPAKSLRAVSNFLGLEWDDAKIAQAIADNTADKIRAGGGTKIPMGGEFRTPSGAVVEPPGFARKARPNAWKEDLSLLDRAQVWIVARQLMGQVGYTWRVPW